MNCFTCTGFNISDLRTYLCIVTARKRSLRRLCFYTCLSTVGAGVGCLGPGERLGVRVGGVSRPIPRGGCWGPDRGMSVHAPIPKGEVGGSCGGVCPGPHLGGAQAWGGVSQHALRQTPPADGYCCGRYASYWNAFLLFMLSADVTCKLRSEFVSDVCVCYLQ